MAYVWGITLVTRRCGLVKISFENKPEVDRDSMTRST